jgi:hypothetical protein
MTLFAPLDDSPSPRAQIIGSPAVAFTVEGSPRTGIPHLAVAVPAESRPGAEGSPMARRRPGGSLPSPLTKVST